jgi:hypothetical protein
MLSREDMVTSHKCVWPSLSFTCRRLNIMVKRRPVAIANTASCSSSIDECISVALGAWFGCSVNSLPAVPYQSLPFWPHYSGFSCQIAMVIDRCQSLSVIGRVLSAIEFASAMECYFPDGHSAFLRPPIASYPAECGNRPDELLYNVHADTCAKQ